MSAIRHYLSSHVWAMHAGSFQSWSEGCIEHASLLRAALSPIESFKRAITGQSTIPVTIANGVATVEISGVLMNGGPWWSKIDGAATDYQDLRSELAKLLQDKSVDSVVLAIDSPGGDATGLADTVGYITALSDAGKPTTARISGMGCSAAYFLAAACDQVMAESDALVGSIGTLTVFTSTEGLQTQLGIEQHLVTNVPGKGLGADGKWTEALRAQLQSMVTAYGTSFQAHVQQSRGFDAAALAAVTTGDAWIATQALQMGLIDAITSASASSTPPAAAGTQQESAMDAKTQAALTALSTKHPTLAVALIGAATLADATPASLQSFVDGEQIKALTTANTDLQSKVTAKDQEIATLSTAKTTAEDKVKVLEARIVKLGGIVAQVPPLVGSDEKPDPIATKTMAEFAQMNLDQRAKYFAAGGKQPTV